MVRGPVSRWLWIPYVDRAPLDPVQGWRSTSTGSVFGGSWLASPAARCIFVTLLVLGNPWTARSVLPVLTDDIPHGTWGVALWNQLGNLAGVAVRWVAWDPRDAPHRWDEFFATGVLRVVLFAVLSAWLVNRVLGAGRRPARMLAVIGAMTVTGGAAGLVTDLLSAVLEGDYNPSYWTQTGVIGGMPVGVVVAWWVTRPATGQHIAGRARSAAS